MLSKEDQQGRNKLAVSHFNSKTDQGLLEQQEYNISQFKSSCPSSRADLLNFQPKYYDSIEDEIELDDQGNNILEKKHMLQQFCKFDCFLLKNRSIIEKPFEAGSCAFKNVSTSSIKGDFSNDQIIEQTNIESNSLPIPAFHTLKSVQIDFAKVASHFQSDKIEQILKLTNQDSLSATQQFAQPSYIQLLNNQNDGNITSNTFQTINFTNQYQLSNLLNQNKFQVDRKQKKAVTIASAYNVQDIMENRKALQMGGEGRANSLNKINVQDILLRLSIRSSLMVYKFIRLIKQSLKMSNDQISNHPQSLIHDLAYNVTETSHKVKKNKSKLSKFLTKIQCSWLCYIFKSTGKSIKNYFLNEINSQPIDPTANWMIVWQCVQFLFIVTALFYTPLEIMNGSTYDKKYGKKWMIFKLINTIAFMADILLKFNTGLFDKGQIVQDRKEIVKRYFRGNFFYDLIALIPVIQTLLQIDYLRPINVLILLKVMTALRILHYLQEMVSQKNNNLINTISLLQLLLMICCVCHIFACMFLGIAILENKYDLTVNNWMRENNLEGDQIHWFTQYISSLYFSVTTMITVGYGDIVPLTVYEIFFVIIAMFVSCGVFAYSFNQIGDLVREQNKMSNEFKSEMVLVNRLLEKKKINRELKIQVRKFLEFRFYAEPQLSMEEEQAVMNKLPHHLKEKVILDSNSQIINSCSLLTSNFSSKFLQNLALKMTEIRVSKNEIIFEKDDEEDDPFLYIINKGTIEIFFETDKVENEVTLITTLEEGMFFGEQHLFKNTPKEISARASDFTILYGISKSQFLSTIKNFPLDFEQYCFMRDSVSFSNQISNLNIKCYACKKDDHSIKTCAKVHYIPNKEFIYLKGNFSLKQTRNNQMCFHKRSKKKSLKERQNVEEIQEYFMEEDQNFIYITANYPEFNNELDQSMLEDNYDKFSQIQGGGGGERGGQKSQVFFGCEQKVLANSKEELNKKFIFTSKDLGQKLSSSQLNINGLEGGVISPNSEKQRHQVNNYDNIPQFGQKQRQISLVDKRQGSQFFFNNNMNTNNTNGSPRQLMNTNSQIGSSKKGTTILPRKFGSNFLNNPINQENKQLSLIEDEEDTTNFKPLLIKQNTQNASSPQNIQAMNILNQLLKALGGINLTNVSGQSNAISTQNEFPLLKNIREYSIKRNTKHSTTIHKKKELINLGQMTDNMSPSEFNEYFEKMKNYTIFYPKQNVNVIIKSLETFQFYQPSYFGVYSLKIRPLSETQKKKIQSEKMILKNNSRRLNRITQNKFGCNSPQNINLSKMESQSSLNIPATNKNNSSFSFKPRKSIISPIFKLIQETDIRKQRASIYLNFQKSSGGFRNNDIGFLGYTTQEKIQKSGFVPYQNTFNEKEESNLDESQEITQKSQLVYPKFIFKKLLTLS